ncbi:hypothetical protein BLOT_010564 [Blomia tropicalis]|nr:hypothetical protein BLOT_010564 [Blomia tropicalis]
MIDNKSCCLDIQRTTQSKKRHGASVRNVNGRQVSYPDTEFIPEVDGETGGSGGGFIQQIFDMIKNLLGMNTRTTIVRNDGTIEEVETPGGGDGLLARLSKKLLGFLSTILGVVSGGATDSMGGMINKFFPSSQQQYTRFPPRSTNEIERELMKLANNNPSS